MAPQPDDERLPYRYTIQRPDGQDVEVRRGTAGSTEHWVRPDHLVKSTMVEQGKARMFRRPRSSIYYVRACVRHVRYACPLPHTHATTHSKDN